MISKSHFIGEHIDNINKYYNFIKELGQGSYGHVIRVQNIVTGHIYACKKMNKHKIQNKQRFRIEIDLLRATDHPNIIKLYDIYEDNVFLYLIMEECLGGEFFDRLARRAKELNMYTEKDAARIFKQLLDAVNYLHAHGVCHRDLKPENILFSTIEEESPLKLIDFGLSKVFNSDHNSMKGAVGTTFYMAPEVITGEYNEKCDVWACGVILYIMLCGKPPFYSRDENELKAKICSMKYDFSYPEFQNISQEGKDLIASILVAKEKRPSITENFVLEHRKKAYIAFCCMRNYVAYRFILTCIRKGYVKQAQQNIVKWKGCLNDFCAGSGKIRDRMKCKAILFLYNKPVMLNLLGKL